MELIKITPDKERAKSIMKIAELIEKRISLQNKNTMAGLIATDYYEIIKELITAILFVDGWKTLSHKDIVDYLSKYYKEISTQEVIIIDDLRVLRNKITYEGFFLDEDYLLRNEKYLKQIIKKLKEVINKKLK